MADDKLEPVACPFCGAVPGVEMNQTAGYRVITVSCCCGARGKSFVRPAGDDRNLAEAIAAWNTRPAPVVEDGLVERPASEIANEICGCSNRDQHRRDIAIIEEVRAQAYAKGIATALRAQSEVVAEREATVAWLREQEMHGVPEYVRH